jgi:hypothetical protein
MKQITLTIAFLLSFNAIGQITQYTDLAKQVTTILEESESIKQLIEQRALVIGQLEDIKQWNLQGTILPVNYSYLKQSYTAYATQMNSIVKELNEDLLSFDSTRSLKGAKLDRFMYRFMEKYSIDIQKAHHIYTSSYSIELEKVVLANNGKSGIIGSIIIIIEFGEILYTTLKSLFGKGKIELDTEKQLIQLAMNYTVTALNKKILFPNWEDIIPEQDTKLSNVRSSNTNIIQQRVRSYRNNTAIVSQPISRVSNTIVENKATLQLSNFGIDTPILFQETGKNIIVGNDLNKINLPIFSTTHAVAVGDRFWVKLNGNYYASFFYYDGLEESWMDPFGKGIIVGSTSNNAVTYLPAENKYFEITEGNEQEHFLILLSKTDIKKSVKDFIHLENRKGIEILEALKENIKEVKFPKLKNSSENMSIIELEDAMRNDNIIPMYFIIDKQNTKL